MDFQAKSLLERHYESRVARIQDRLKDISASFTKVHEGEKGTSNENVLRDFLKEFLPQKYAIGSGFVIDSHGGVSKQTDIILYDRLFNPELFRYEGANFFPAEVVYGIIEVKTTLDSAEIKDSVDKIASVKTLQFQKMSLAHPVEGGLGFGTTSAPLGFVFAYSTSIRKVETLLKNFQGASEDLQQGSQFDLVGILHTGCVVHTKSGQIAFSHHGLLTQTEQGKLEEMTTEEKSAHQAEIDGKQYPTFLIMGRNAIVDPVRNFLMFLDMFYETLNTKFVPEVQNVLQTYVPPHLKKQLIIALKPPST